MSVQAQYDASELITQREMVSAKITDELTARAEQFGIILDDISIVSKAVIILKYSSAYSNIQWRKVLKE